MQFSQIYFLRGEIFFSSVLLQKRLKVSKQSFKITLFLSQENTLVRLQQNTSVYVKGK